MPVASFVAVLTIAFGAGGGGVSMRTVPPTVSTYAVSSLPAAALTMLASFASLGTVTPAFSGALTMTSRLRSVNHSFARRFTSSMVISGRKRWFSAS